MRVASSNMNRADMVAAEMRSLGLRTGWPPLWLVAGLLAALNAASALATLASF